MEDTKALHINRVHLVETNEILVLSQMWINPTNIDSELLFVQTVSTFICQDSESY